MANPEHVEILRQGVDAWNKWRAENSKMRIDLTGADLKGINLRKIYLYRTDLRGAIFEDARLSRADFYDSNLTDTNFQFADLRRVKFEKANLSGSNLSNADLRKADFFKANLYDANLCGADLQLAQLVETNLELANLTGCNVYGISAWNLRLKGTEHLNLRISKENEPIVTVDDIEIAQFIYLILNHKKLRNAIDVVTNKGVLILGRFGGGGLEVLQAIASQLREMKYLPIIFNFERPRDRNYTETIKILVSLARFVIVDLSGPSVPQELSFTVPHYKIPFVPIMEKGKHPYSMFADILEYDWVLEPVVEFGDKDELVKELPEKIIEPAEMRIRARKRRLAELYNN